MLRIEGLIDQACVLGDMSVALGSPLAGLTRDLRQVGEDLATDGSSIYGVQVLWLKSQFEAAGFRHSGARAYTRFLIAGYRGWILLAYSQGDRGRIEAAAISLKCWLRHRPCG